MALNNILPFTANGAGGSHYEIRWFQCLDASPAVTGEPVVVDSNGFLDECADDPSQIAGIAAGVPVNGFSGATLNYPLVNGLNPDRAIAAADALPVIMAGPNQLFITNTLLSNGSAFATTPTLAHIGDFASLDLISGVWGLRPGGGTNQFCKIVDVLDARGRSLSTPFANPGTGVSTVFKVTYVSPTIIGYQF